VPTGGEDLDRYVGSPRLLRATGSEPFDPVTDSQLKAAREELAEHLRSMGPDVRVMDRLITGRTSRPAPHRELS
jgi:DNA/RNA-binding domain of Phe-tRNA-synthetase-like protein